MKFSQAGTIALIGLSLGLYGCGGSDSKKTVKKVEDKVKEAVLDGIWQSQTHGFYLDFNNGQYTAYDVTPSYCIKSLTLSAFGYDVVKQSSVFNHPNEIAVDFNDIKMLPIKFNRVEQLPEPCQSEHLLDHQSDVFNPLVTFNLFWETYQTHFAFNHFNRVDWINDYQGYSNRISADATPPEVLMLIDEILAELKDGHSSFVYAEGEDISYDPRGELEQDIYAAFYEQDEIDDVDDFFEIWMEKHQQTKASYVEPSFSTQALHNGKLKLNMLKDNIAYLDVTSMFGITGSEDIEDAKVLADVAAIHDIMNQAIPVINGSKGLILDLRLNGGGHDLVAMALFSHLIDTDTVIGRKRIKTDDGFTEFFDIKVQPAKGERYLGPIVVLTSEYTASAAEVFGLAMLARDKVTFVGENTNGSFSDSLPKTLPNGWSFSLSNEQYQDSKGNDYESIGIPVQHSAPLFSPEKIEQGIDAGIEQGIAILK
ncbi:S41 family peptidase [Motilimonas sp. KMU-193]|uniref:S41 family peptidase n=1 Tax=Motilimonas sp. KMU-193 TaxID=3388668 RepID=UPI00396AFD52